jgi:hypothetical protein
MAKIFYGTATEGVHWCAEVTTTPEQFLAQVRGFAQNCVFDLVSGGLIVLDRDRVSVMQYEPGAAGVGAPTPGDRAQIEAAVRENNAARNGGPLGGS